jgi:hypothetical protein
VKERRRPDEPPVFDVHTPTEREVLLASIAKRRRRYFRVMVPCIVLMLFGFFVPAPIPVRLTALAIAACMPPIAAMLGNTR